MKKIILIVLIILVIIFPAGCSKKDSEVEEQPAETVAVEIKTPLEGSISKNVTLNGVLEPIKEVTMVAQVLGVEKVTDLSIKNGDMVKEGDILVKIDDETIRDQVDATHLSFESAKNNYYQMKKSYDDGREAFENAKKLYEKGAISKDQFEAAEIAASDYQGNIIEGQLEQAKLAYDIAKKQLEDSTIVSPINGIVSDMNFVEDGYASSQSYIKISDTSKVKINLEFTERVINNIKLGQNAKVYVSSIDKEVECKVEELNTVANSLTGLYEGAVIIDNPDFELKSGMVAKVDISFDEDNEYFLLPVNSVLSDSEGYFVYSVSEDKAGKKRVSIGDDDGEFIEVYSGIDENDKVVVKGQEFIKDSVNVKVVRGE